MKVLVTGAKGQLGSDVMAELALRNIEAVGLDIEDMDITNETEVIRVINEVNPTSVIHCAAYVAVDAAEDNEELCRNINAYGTEYIAKMCKKMDIPMMYISTDYVFNGKGDKPWNPDNTDREPCNVYGMTKYEGELAVEKYLEKYFIVRISWVFGLKGKNFINTMVNLGKTRGAVSVVNDQFGSPTYTYDLARLLVDMIQTDKYGRYHASNEGICSWYEFAVEIFKQAGLEVEVTPVDSSAFPVRAVRPKNSRMDKNKLVENGFRLLPDWQNALGHYLKEWKE
jgi:dTDP-4-dehydrorhamnose reductase